MRGTPARVLLGFGIAALFACSPGPGEVELRVPRGHSSRLELAIDGRLHGFGPFVGYYFRPDDPRDLGRLRFLCFNERGFYASDAAVNALLYEGEARLARLPSEDFPVPRGEDRIQPVFFTEAPAAWLATRPDPAEEFVHFHSAYDATGPALAGYWLRHVAVASFTYDMGGRVCPGGPLHHVVIPGPDRAFARLVEFDRGPPVP